MSSPLAVCSVRRVREICVRVFVAAFCTAVALPAQPSLRILRYAPADSASAGSTITVTFSRPVAARLASAIDASTVMAIEPAVKGTFDWRDPVTLRFRPSELMLAGQTYAINIDTAAIASAGKRRSARFQFKFRVPPPVKLHAVSLGMDSDQYSVPSLGPTARFQILYSAAVNIDSVAKLSQLVFPASCGGTIPLRVVRQRAVARRGDRFSDWVYSDTIAARTYRVVELVPNDSLKPGCDGRWTIPLFNDVRARAIEQQPVRTYPEFHIDSIAGCIREDANTAAICNPDGILVWFSAPMRVDALRKYLHVNPTSMPISLSGEYSMAARYKQMLVPRQKYTVTVDSGMRDIYGRQLQGAKEISVVARDRAPGLIYQSGLVTLPNNTSVLRVRTVNVDTLLMLVSPVPDTSLFSVLGSRGFGRANPKIQNANAVPASDVTAIPIREKFNEEQETTVTLPRSVRASGNSPLSVVRFVIKARSVTPEEAVVKPQAQLAGSLLSPAAFPNAAPPLTHDFGLVTQTSNLRAHTKILESSGAVLVTNADGTPVSGARVTLFDEAQGARVNGVTGRDGLAMLTLLAARDTVVQNSSGPGWWSPPRYLDITSASDRLIVPLQGAFSNGLRANLAPWSLTEHVTSGDSIHGTVFTDRGIYRPGEMVYVKAYARVGVVGSIGVPQSDSSRFTLYNDDEGDSVSARVSTLTTFGTAFDSIQIRPNEKLGTYSLRSEINLGGVWRHNGWVEFQVADFRAPDFQVNLTPDAVRYVGDSVHIGVDARYLFGSPMRGAQVSWSATVEGNHGSFKPVPNTRGYTIGQFQWWEDDPQPESAYFTGTDSLDASGRLHFSVVTANHEITRDARLNVEVTVTDVNNQAVSKTTVVHLQAAEYQIGARTRGTASSWKTGVKQTIDAIVVRNSGERVAGVPLSATIVRRRWTRDTVTQNSRWTADTLQQFTITSSTDSIAIEFTPQADGAYDVRLEARDAAGHVARTNLGQWAYAQPWMSAYGTNPVKLQVVVQPHDRDEFSFGDTARVSFESPFERAVAWITLEREGIIEQRTMNVVRGTTHLPVPITRKFAPNIWVGVTLVNQIANSANATEEVMRAGYAQLKIDSTAHQLHVSVKPIASQLLPGDSARVRVEVRDMNAGAGARGVRSEVALWAVDEGALSLTDYRTPNILRDIDERLGVSLNLYSTLTELPWRAATGAVGIGTPYHWINDGSMLSGRVGGVNRLDMTVMSPPASSPRMQTPNPSTRSVFRYTAFFVGATVTDSNGFATITAKLPDNITTFRLMAAAVTSGEGYGSGEAPLLVSRRVVVRPSLPRFVRAGDSLAAAVVVNVKDSLNASLNVRANVSGGVLYSDSSQRVGIVNGSSARAPFAIRVPEHNTADSLRVQVTAIDSAVRDGDAITTMLPIHPAGTPRAHTFIGVVRNSANQKAMLPRDIDPERSTVSINLGASPLVAMRTHYARLREYPYYNTELLTTSARALLSLSRAERTLGDIQPTRDSATVVRDLQRAVDEISSREAGDGLFANWPRTTISENAWFSAYIGNFLVDAQEEGVTVSEELLDRIREALSTLLKNQHWRTDTLANDPIERRNVLRYRASQRLVALRYLRDIGKPDEKMEDSLAAAASFLSWEDRVGLIDLLSERDDNEDRVMALLQQAWRAVSVAGKRIDLADSLRGSGFFVSHIRPAAHLLRTTMKLQPEHPLLGALAETLIQQGSAEPWAWNSLDYASAIEALADYAVEQRGAVGERVVARGSDGRVLFDRSRNTASNSAMSAVDSVHPLTGLIRAAGKDSASVDISMQVSGGSGKTKTAPLYYSITVNEIPRTRPVTPDIAGLFVERWYERADNGKPVSEVTEGDLVLVQFRVTVPADRQYVVLEDLLPAGLEPVDMSLTSAARTWTPWEYSEMHDERVFFYARMLWSGQYTASYLARATTAGTFVKPPAHAEELYNRALQGRSDGGTFVVRARRN